MLLEKQHDAVHRLRQMIVQFDVVEDIRLVPADEASTLHPCIGEIPLALLSDEQNRSLRRYKPPLLILEQSQREQFVFANIEPIAEQGFQR